MTTREATEKIERLLYPTVHEINKKDPYYAQEIDEAWLLIRRIVLTGYKPENSPSDKGTTSAGLDMPESPNDAKTDCVKVVRCKDCKHRNFDYCHNYDGFARFDSFFAQEGKGKTMARLINKDVLLETLNAMYKQPKSTEDYMTIGYDHAIADAVVTAHEQPAIKPKQFDCWGCNCSKIEKIEPKHGRWEYTDYGGVGNWHYSVCHNIVLGAKGASLRTPYCPNCGAKMDEVE